MPLIPNDNPQLSQSIPALTTNSVAHPDTWNPVHQALLDNDVFLSRTLEATTAALASQVAEIDGRVDTVETASAVSVQRAIDVDWLYRGNRIALELFTPDYSMLDTAAIGVLSAIAGDDSLDVSATDALVPGGEYVIFDAINRETVKITQALTANRVRIDQPLQYAYDNTATLARTSMDIAFGEGAAQPGDVYFSRQINLGSDGAKRALVIRRGDNAAAVRVYYRYASMAAWAEAPWAWQRRGESIPAGMVDVEYEVASNGNCALKIVVEGAAVTLSHIVGVGAGTGLGGTHNPPAVPVMSYPQDGAEGMTDRPTLSVSGYASPTSTPVAASQFQISPAADGFNEPMIDSGRQAGGLSWQEVGLRLETSTQYFVRGRVQDEAAAWSPWSAPVSFTTSDSFVYVQSPVNTGPAANLTNVADNPTLQSNAFAVYAGEDTHEATQWQIRKTSTSYEAPILDTGIDAAGNLEAFTVPEGLLESNNTEYFFRVRHKGAVIGWSGWSVETRFTTKKAFGSVIGIALVTTGGGSGQWARIDEDGNAKTADVAYFNSHPTYAGIVDQAIDSQLMVKVPKFFIKTGLVSSGAYIGKRAIWISDKKEAGFEVHPAFKSAGAELSQYWVGKYQAGADGTKTNSVAGVAPLVSINFATMQARCEARNTAGVTGFALWDVYQLSAIKALCLIEMGGADSQSLIGQGHTSSSAALVNNHATVAQASWRGIVGLWGNVWQMVDGLQTDAALKYKIWDRNGTKSYVTTNQLCPTASSSYIVTMSEDAGADYNLTETFLPATVDPSASNSSYADGLWSAANCVAYHGGGWGNGALDGLFCLDVSSAASGSDTSIGGRLAKV